jgi:hypothetical protein
MDGNAYEYGTDPCRRISPNTCYSKCGPLPELLRTVVHIRRTPSGHIAGSPRRQPSYDPNRRYGSWHRAHHDRNEILGMVCFYSSDNWKLGNSIIYLSCYSWLKKITHHLAGRRPILETGNREKTFTNYSKSVMGTRKS